MLFDGDDAPDTRFEGPALHHFHNTALQNFIEEKVKSVSNFLTITPYFQHHLFICYKLYDTPRSKKLVWGVKRGSNITLM